MNVSNVTFAPDCNTDPLGCKLVQDDAIMALQREVGRISSLLNSLAAERPLSSMHEAIEPTRRLPEFGPISRARQEQANGAEHSDLPHVTAAEVRTILRQRRAREQYFDADLFADPAWDMILDLYAAWLDGKRVSVSSLCVAAAVPATTALRWIRVMEERGHFARKPDQNDARRIYVELSGPALVQLHRYFARTPQAARHI